MNSLDDVRLYKMDRFEDPRGSFIKIYSKEEKQDIKFFAIKQVNLSVNMQKGTVRGMHFQENSFMEDKIVTCISGNIFDVIVDVQKESTTYLQHRTFHLQSANSFALLIPKGFAHGFQTLNDDTSVLYLHSNDYSQEHESGLNPLDPILQIDWPTPVTMISSRDSEFPLIEKG
jgi:dTDP-4-dehydrorhamnose 3,5-epimerase